MEQSAENEFSTDDIQIFFLFANRDAGGKAIKPGDYMDEITALSHKDESGTPISCAAMALAYATKTTTNPRRDLPHIKSKAVEIQALCGYAQFVHISQFQVFIDHFPNFRITVVTSPLPDQSR